MLLSVYQVLWNRMIQQKIPSWRKGLCSPQHPFTQQAPTRRKVYSHTHTHTLHTCHTHQAINQSTMHSYIHWRPHIVYTYSYVFCCSTDCTWTIWNLHYTWNDANIVHLQLTTLFSRHFQEHKENLFAEIELIPVSITTNILVAMVSVLLSILVVLVHIFGREVLATQWKLFHHASCCFFHGHIIHLPNILFVLLPTG